MNLPSQNLQKNEKIKIFHKTSDYLQLKTYKKFKNLPYISKKELKKHNSREDCWMAVKGIVYDVTKYLNDHPGGRVILQGAGKDATKLLEEEHKWVNEKYILKGLEVGLLDDFE